MPTSKAHIGGLVGELHLAVDAKVILTANVDVSDGLVNTVEAIIHTTATNEVSLVLSKFHHPRVGSAALTQLTSDTKSPEDDPQALTEDYRKEDYVQE